jgi:hypothetical protein
VRPATLWRVATAVFAKVRFAFFVDYLALVASIAILFSITFHDLGVITC